jgi:hypothetical protein
MKTGYLGTFVISWSQTDVDGEAAPRDGVPGIGATWRWSGQTLRVDGPAELLLLHDAEGEAERRARAARVVRRLLGAAVSDRMAACRMGGDPGRMPEDDSLPQRGFVVTDGRNSFAVSIIEVSASRARLLMFTGVMPPADTDLWVIARTEDRPGPDATPGGMVCFTPGTRIAVPGGQCAVEDLRPGDRVLTKDDGPQQILWTGRRKMTGARLFAMPALRPVRIRSGAMGEDRPEGDLIVSPDHRLVVRGERALALFNTPEVLVAARDLIDHRAIRVETGWADVTYIHLLTARHEVVWANGVESETFHPASADMEMIDPGERAALLALRPEIERDPAAYGAPARRHLTRPEAAILRHEAA